MKKNLFIYLSSFFICFYTGCCSSSPKMDLSSSDTNQQHKKIDELLVGCSWSNGSAKSKKVNLAFLNDPYNITKNDRLVVLFDTIIIYDGLYNSYNKAYVPESFANKYVQLRFMIYSNGTTYSFSNMQLVKWHPENDMIQIVYATPPSQSFMPFDVIFSTLSDYAE
ncbi:MAG: hypothetical protein JST82_15495 [Bacteroidetes bacterium]|nr:hypothetical protein [Bacteroidota bacterium]